MADIKISEMDNIGLNLTNDDIIPIVDSGETENKNVTVGELRDSILSDTGDISIFYSLASENAVAGSKSLNIESTLVSDGVTLVPTVEGVSISTLLIENAGRYRLKYSIGFQLDGEGLTDKKVLAYFTHFGIPVPCSISSALLRNDQDYIQLSGTAIIDSLDNGIVGIGCLSNSTGIKTADNTIDGFTPAQYKLMVSVERIK